MELKKYRLIILIALALGVAALLWIGGSILADAYGLTGPEKADCCATGFDPGPPEPSRPIPADKL